MKRLFKMVLNPGKEFKIMAALFTIFCLLFAIGCKKELKAGSPIALSYDKVFLIGDATTAGWTIANALPMTRSTDVNVFTWMGPLSAGEIKFPTAMNFSSDTFAAASASQSVSNTKSQLSPNGNPDVKWKLTAADAGTYKITVNTKDFTVAFKKQ